jgi:mono/diheme cytochrome c family protein
MNQIIVTHLALSASVLAAVTLAAGCANSDPTGAPSTASGEHPLAESNAPAALIARGNHLVSTSGCHDCHTPLKLGNNGPEPDLTRALSGHPESMKLPPAPAPQGPWMVSVAATNTAWSGPWGVSFTANLTPDRETGLGEWTRDTFIQTIRTGRHLGRGRPLLPPMPIPVYQNFSDDELGSIFAYLQTLPAVKNHVPEPLAPSAPSAPAKLSKADL